MLPVLTPLELGRLRMSVGYGMHKKGRPLSPIEVGLHLRRACDAGMSLTDCANEIQLNGTGHIGRFLRILKLPLDLQHLINWGSGKDFIGFSSAVELVRLQNPDDQRILARSILTNGLTKNEVRQIVQLRIRTDRTISDCVTEILGMRTLIEKRFIFIGSLNDQIIMDELFMLTQIERDSILDSCIKRLGLQEVSGRLGKQLFTLVGGSRFNESMRDIGKENIESQLQTLIAKAVEDA